MSLVLSQIPDCFILQCFLKRRTLLRKTCISPSIHWNRSPLFLASCQLCHWSTTEDTGQSRFCSWTPVALKWWCSTSVTSNTRARLHHLPNSVLHICISPEAAAWLFSCHGIMISITFIDYLKHSLEGLDGNSSNETVRKHSCRST